MKTKTHEVCAECGQHVALDNPHVIARKQDDTLVYLHVNPCFNRYSRHHALSYVVLFSSEAVYGGGS